MRFVNSNSKKKDDLTNDSNIEQNKDENEKDETEQDDEGNVGNGSDNNVISETEDDEDQSANGESNEDSKKSLTKRKMTILLQRKILFGETFIKKSPEKYE